MELRLHIVFIPKYRRKVMYGKVKKDIVNILEKLCEMNSTHRWESMRKRCTYVFGNTAVVWHIKDYIIFKGKDHSDAVRHSKRTRKTEVIHYAASKSRNDEM